MSQQSDDGRLPETVSLELLASRQRRVLLERLASGETQSQTLDSLASAVTRSRDADQFQRVSLSLHHVHLPKLDDADVLAYDPNTKTVEWTDDAKTARLLERLSEA